MEQGAPKPYPSAIPERKKYAWEERLEKKLNGVNSFFHSIINIKEKITYFKGKNYKSKTKFERFKTLTVILRSVDGIVIFGATIASKTLPATGVGLIVVPISAVVECALSLSNKIIHEIFINDYNKY